MDLLSIILEEFRGPRKAVSPLKIVRSKSASYHSTLRAKY